MKKKTQNTILIIAILLAFVFVVFGAWMIIKSSMQKATNKANVEWYDENGTEFVITTADELYGMVKLSEFYDFEGQTVKLGADIVVNKGNASDWVKKAPARKWYPITGFKGTFDGQGYSISGIYGKSLDSAMGLFSDTQRGCVIRDFRLLNSYFSGSSEGTGSIASHGGGTFDTIYTDAIIATNYPYAGGIIGQVSISGEHKITNCWFDGTITMKSEEGIYGGGIAGAISGEGGIITIEHTLNTGTISAEGSSRAVDIGGFCGSTDKGAVLNVTDSLNAGTVEAKYDKLVGALLGDIKAGSKMTASHTYSIQESYNKTVGYQAGSVKGTPIVYPQELIKGHGGYQWTTLDFDKYWAVDMDATPILKTFAEDVPSLAGIKKCYDIDWYDQFGTEFVISTLEEFYGFYILSANDNFEGKIVKLGADLAVNEGKATTWGKKAPENPWYPINSFAGMFDGQGYTISGLYVKGNTQKLGMFSEITNGGSVTNLKLTNSYFEFTDTTMALLGSIAGRGNGTFDTIYSDAILVCHGTGCGGIVGQVSTTGAMITNCWYDGEIQMKGETGRQVAGILGITRAEVDIDHCLNTSKITVETKGGIRAAGLLGIATGNEFTFRITDCLTAGRIYAANSRIGAAIGEIQEGKTAIIRDVYAISESLSADEGKTFINKAIGHIAPEVAATEKAEAIPAAIADGSAVMIPEAGIKGYLGYQWTTLNFEKFWSVNLKGTPILTSFAKKSPSVAGLKKKIDTSWYKEDAKTYTIKTPEQLNGFFVVSALSNFEGKTVKLGNDITVNAGSAADWATNRPTDMWYPINTFAGTFDGQGHTISGLYMKSATQKIGLFSETTPEAVVKNFRLTNSYMESTSTGMALIGSIAGRGDGTFDTIYSDAIIVCSGTGCGGLVGQVYTEGNNKITNCWYDGKMSVTTDAGKQAGGILGIARAGVTIEHCLNTADITMEATAALRVGGILGIMTGGEPYTVTISDCLSAGTITTANSRVGAIVAEVQADKKLVLKDTYALAEGMTTGKAYIKKLFGHIDKKAVVEGVAALIPAELLKGTNAAQWTTLDFAKYWGAKTDAIPELASFTAGENLNVAGLPKKSDISWYNQNANEFVIDSVEDLYGLYIMSIATNFKDQSVKLAADLDVNTGNAAAWATSVPANVWYPLNTFAGTFDGQGHRISGLYLKRNEPMIGFISQMADSATVKNLKITNSYMESTSTGSAWLGTFAGRGNGTFDTVYSDAIIVSSGTGIGGIIGQTYYKGTKINNAWFDGSITMTTKAGVQVGGIVGIARQSIAFSNCLNTGDITVEHNAGIRASGILGIMTGDKFEVTMDKCLTTGKITAANARVGVVIGEVQEGKTLTLNEVYATAESHYDGEKYITRAVGHSDGKINGTGVIVPESSFTGSGAYLWTTFDFDNVWVAKAESTPELKSFSTGENLPVVGGMRADTRWYEKKDYNIDSVAELCGLAKLSWNHDFKGITLKLGKKDAHQAFKLNGGSASEWAEGLNIPANKWISIGTEEKPFAGTFNGQGNSISGVYMETAGKYAGLFAKTVGTVKNLKLINSYFEFNGNKNAYLGSVAGCGGGTFDTIYSDAIVVSSGINNGGIIGSMDKGGIITNCQFDGSVDLGKNAGQYAGGIVGLIQNEAEVTIEHCLNSGTITGEQQSENGTLGLIGLGGLCAYVYTGDLEIKDSLNVGEIQGVGNRIASVIARLGHGSDDATAKITDTYYCTDNCNVSLTEHKAEGAKILTGKPEGLVLSSFEDNYGWYYTSLDFDNYWNALSGDVPELKSFTSDKELAFIMKADTDWYEKNKDAEKYNISTKAELYGLVKLAKDNNFADVTINLQKENKDGNFEITINDYTTDENGKVTVSSDIPWVPIGTKDNPFAGTFNGNMNTISGIYFETNAPYGGLFAAVATAKGADEAATVQNLKLTNSHFEFNGTKNAYLGSIAGSGNGNFNTIYSKVDVISSGVNNGGIIGAMQGAGTVEKCWFDGTLELGTDAGQYGGGIIGLVESGAGATVHMNNCLNSGNLSGTRTDGSIIGLSGLSAYVYSGKLDVDSCLHAGTITGEGNRISYLISRAGDVECTNTYYCNEQGFKHAVWGDNGSSTGVKGVSLAGLTGYSARFNAPLLTYKDGYWILVEDTTPQLENFKMGVPVNTWAGEGTEDDPWMITSADELMQLAEIAKTYNFSGKYIQLKNDIPVDNGTENWTPIGTETNAFAGHFNGDNKTISGLRYAGDGTNIGLFGRVGATGNISNFTLADSTFESTATGNTFIGGIVGYAQGGNYTNIKVANNVTVATTGSCAGGIAGTAWGGNATFDTCWSAARINMNGADARQAGGIVGRVYGGGRTITIRHCLNTGDVISTTTTKTPHVGGLCGLLNGATLNIVDSLNTKNVQSQYTEAGYVGSIIGTIEAGDAKFTLNQVYGINGYELFGTNSGTFDTENSANHKVLEEGAMQGDAAWLNMKLDYNTYWKLVNDATPELRSFQSNAPEVVVWEGKGTKDEPWILDSADELMRLAVAAKTHDFKNEYIQLGTNAQKGTLTITIPSGTAAEPTNWTPIGSETKPFAGTFDGNGNTISGIYYRGNGTYIGLFGSVGSSGVIQNLGLTNSSFEHTGGVASAKLGSIAGYSVGKLERVKSDATVKSNAPHNGGLVGHAEGGTIIHCWYDGSMTLGANGKFSGGIVGNVINGTVTINNCLFSKSIYGDGAGTSAGYGGLCGQVEADGTLILQDSLAYGSVGVSTTSNWYGSIVGYIYGTGEVNVSNVYTKKDICRFALRNRSGSIIYNGSTLTGNIENSTYTEALTTEQLKGNKASLNTALDFTNHWQEVTDGFPVLKNPIIGAGTPDVVEWTGAGTPASPYIIDSEAELRLLAERSLENQYAGKYFQLGADITVTGGTATEPTNWTPIGSESKPFEGNFDGNGKTISGIHYKGNGTYIGLFASVGSSGVIQNLGLTNSTFEHTGGVTSAKLGSIAGYSIGKLERVKSDATVKSNAPHNGGLVGYAEGGTIIHCWYDGSMTLGANGKFSGGIVGNVINGTVTIYNCLFSKSIYGDGAGTSAGYGGLCGQVEADGTLILQDSLAYGSVGVSTTSNWYGSIVGYIYGTGKVNVSNVYTKEDICRFAFRNRSGSIIYNGTPLTGNIENSTYTEALTADELKGNNAKTNTQLNFTDHWQEVTDGFPVLKNPVGGVEAPTVVEWTGEGTQASPYIIDSEAELRLLAERSLENQYAGKYFKLGANILVTGGTATDPTNWTPIGSESKPFAGNFDGNGKTISGIHYKGNGTYIGLFGSVGSSGVIQNLGLTNSTFEHTGGVTSAKLGSIAGYSVGKLERVKSDATVKSNAPHNGGLVGHAEGGTIIHCWYDGAMTLGANGKFSGGIVGNVTNGTVTINNCLFSKSIYGAGVTTSAGYGGLCGQVEADGTLILQDSLAYGSVGVSTTSNWYGSIVGYIYGTGKVNVSNVYTKEDICRFAFRNRSGSIIYNGTPLTGNIENSTYTEALTADELKGNNAKTNTQLNFTDHWQEVTDGLPVLKNPITGATVGK